MCLLLHDALYFVEICIFRSLLYTTETAKIFTTFYERLSGRVCFAAGLFCTMQCLFFFFLLLDILNTTETFLLCFANIMFGWWNNFHFCAVMFGFKRCLTLATGQLHKIIMVY